PRRVTRGARVRRGRRGSISHHRLHRLHRDLGGQCERGSALAAEARRLRDHRARVIIALLLFGAACRPAAPDPYAAQRLAALRDSVPDRGAAPRAFDRNGALLAPDLFRPYLGTLAGQGSATIETTLDPFVQRAALEALGSYRGAIVAIDPRTN